MVVGWFDIGRFVCLGKEFCLFIYCFIDLLTFLQPQDVVSFDGWVSGLCSSIGIKCSSWQ